MLISSAMPQGKCGKKQRKKDVKVESQLSLPVDSKRFISYQNFSEEVCFLGWQISHGGRL
jgi:hypothetical protein